MDTERSPFKNITSCRASVSQYLSKTSYQPRKEDDSRKDAKLAKTRIFAQSGDDDWAKDVVFTRAMFLSVVISRQTKSLFSAPSASLR